MVYCIVKEAQKEGVVEVRSRKVRTSHNALFFIFIFAKLKNANYLSRLDNLSYKYINYTVTFSLYLISYILTLKTHIKLLAKGV